MPVKAVFFDAGQTLLDAHPPAVEVYRRAFAAWGVSAELAEVGRAVKETWREVDERRARGEQRWGGDGGEVGFWRAFVAAAFGRVGGGPLPEDLLQSLVAHFRREENWRLYPEVIDVLSELRHAGRKLLVVSNWDSTLPGLLTRMGIAPFFDAFVVSAVVGASKPSRRIFDEALRISGVEPAEALHVGDSPDEDYGGAVAAGLGALLVDRHGIHPAHADRIASLTEVVPRVLGPLHGGGG